MSYLKEQWKKYAARKTKAGIVIDFLLLFLVLAMIHPTSRMSIRAFVAKVTMSSPNEVETKKTLNDFDYKWNYKTLQGEAVNFESHKGKVVFLNFWATWCPPCVAEFPAIEDLYTQYGNEVEFILISNESASVVESFVQKEAHKAPVYIKNDPFPPLLSPKAFPTTYVISKSGKIVLEKTGAAKWNSESVKTIINKLIAE